MRGKSRPQPKSDVLTKSASEEASAPICLESHSFSDKKLSSEMSMKWRQDKNVVKKTIPANRVVNKKRIIGKMEGRRGEVVQGVATPPPPQKRSSQGAPSFKWSSIKDPRSLRSRSDSGLSESIWNECRMKCRACDQGRCCKKQTFMYM
jgi:hypothetical protein